MDSLITDTLDRIYEDFADDAKGLWQALQENGLTRAWIPENLGGTGLELSDGFDLIRQSASKFTAVPFAETLLAGFLLATANTETPDGKISICLSDTGTDAEAPFVDQADYIIRLTRTDTETTLDIFKSVGGSIPGNVGPDPMSTIHFDQKNLVSSVTAPAWLTPDAYQQLGAAVRTAQLCGAMQRELELTLEHTSTREQFGRPLTRFQAIQHLLAEIAGELATSSAALEGAIQTISLNDAPDLIAIACAKTRASEAADIVAKNAHQAHGAIGFTGEYSLGRFSRRLWQWREDFGNEFHWGKLLGQHFASTDSGNLTEEIFGATNG